MEQQVHYTEGTPTSPSKPSRKKIAWWMFAIGFVVIIILGIVADALWSQYFSPAAQNTQRMQEQYAKYESWEQSYRDALKTDTYGEKTPQETLSLFIAALEKEDVDLASKYFMIDNNLSRQKWVDFLTKIKNEGNMQRFASDLKSAKKGNSLSTEDAGFVLLNDDGTVGFQFNLRLNKYSQLWKIESL